jgi:hypothetical protein
MKALIEYALHELTRFLLIFVSQSLACDRKATHLGNKIFRERRHSTRDEIVAAERRASLNELV